MPVADAFKAKSRSSRRGPQNPGRQRQPVRKGRAMGMFGKVMGMVRGVLKGPDKGMG